MLTRFLLSAYFRHPRLFWPGDRSLQRDRLEKVLSAYNEKGSYQIARALTGVARRRAMSHAPVLHIVNMGSSGSHWLEWLVAGATEVNVAREVYLPARLRLLTPVGSLRRKLVETVVLLHGDRPIEESTECPLIHSAHSFSLSPEPGVDNRFQRVFLFRDPLDIVLSRTFRKTWYREWIAPDTSDRDYLFRNIRIVRRLHSRAFGRDASATLHYEDLVADPEQALSRLFETLGWPADSERIRKSVRRKPPKQRSDSAPGGSEDVIPPKLRAEAAEALSGLRQRLGYI